MVSEQPRTELSANLPLARTLMGIGASYVLGGVFAFAAIAKLSDPYATLASAYEYRLLTPAMAEMLTGVLPFVEILVAMSLLTRTWIRGGLVLSLLLLAVFAAGQGWVVWGGWVASCGCFGADSETVGAYTLTRTLGLAVLAGIGCWATRPHDSTRCADGGMRETIQPAQDMRSLHT